MFFKKKEPKLLNDIKTASEWVANALNSSGYKADYTLDSLKEIDRFFDEQNTPDGILSKNTGSILFSIGSYIGDVAIRYRGGCWSADDKDPYGEINIEVILSDGTKLWPVQRAMKRFKTGQEESISAYLEFLRNTTK